MTLEGIGVRLCGTVTIIIISTESKGGKKNPTLSEHQMRI
jgi:hypothetical protein